MKKGFALIHTLIAVLILVLGAFILYTFAGDLKGVLKEDADIETCRLSVLAQAQTKLAGKSVVSLDCPRRNLRIYENKVDVNGAKSKKYSFKELNSEELNHLIAEELRLCWYQMAEGNRDVFENSIFIGTENTCLICSEIEFDEKLKLQPFTGLLDYLKSKKIPKSDVTYFNYLVKSQRSYYGWMGNVPWAEYTPFGYGTSTTNKVAESQLNTNQKYLIYFLALKPPWLLQFGGAYKAAYYIGLGKEEKIQEECNIWIN